MSVRCAECGLEIDQPPEVPAEERIACPNCGSFSRAVEMTGTVHAHGSLSAEESVLRGLNDIRLALLGILVGIALTVGFGVSGPWLLRVGLAVASFVVSALLLRWQRSRSALMELMHRISGH